MELTSTTWVFLIASWLIVATATVLAIHYIVAWLRSRQERPEPRWCLICQGRHGVRRQMIPSTVYACPHCRYRETPPPSSPPSSPATETTEATPPWSDAG